MKAGRIRAGIGGWVYEPWNETFYPAGLPKAKQLAHASRQVTTIEINATFYRTQSPQSFRRWAEDTPDDFVFSLKANRYAVNRKDLSAARDSIMRFVESGITELGAKLGPILWQLAGTKRFDAAELEAFFSHLPDKQDGVSLRHVLEPRHESFSCAEYVELARKYQVATCLALSDDYPMIADPTASFCYLRLQTTASDEPNGLSAGTIATWAQRLRGMSQGRADGLPSLSGPASEIPRDCFVYMIAGAKERNPAAALALLAALDEAQR